METTINSMTKDFTNQNVESEVLEVKTLVFEENQLLDNTTNSNCDPYGCTCIAYEKCCGCLLQ